MSDATPTVEGSVKPPRRLRRTRIGVTVFFGVLTVAFCVLWMRSYRMIDLVRAPFIASYSFAAESTEGRLSVGLHNYPHPWEMDFLFISDQDGMWYGEVGKGSDFTKSRLAICLPYWFLMIVSVSISALPWIPLPISFSNRFSLNTMLLVTTLVAAALVWCVLLTR